MDEVQQMDQQNISDDADLAKLQEDLENAMDNWKRTAADFENYKKRKEAENKELIEFAREVTVAKLLPALDSLEQALRHMPEYMNHGTGSMNQGFEKQYENWMVGINGILSQLDKTLSEMGVKKIEAVGKKFDPHFHEAVREVESEADDGTIIEELQSGFELNGKVIRPSQVTISKRKLL